MAVTFREQVIPGVLPGVDRYTDQALEIAKLVSNEYGTRVYKAEVDRFDGLIVYWMDEGEFEIGDTNEPRGWHFVSPICGYDGTGPATTALILQMFGFGSAEDMIYKINHGDNTAHFVFTKEAALQ